jgi:segregation and condensation protein A
MRPPSRKQQQRRTGSAHAWSHWTCRLAAWLERPPQLGHEVFARGQREIFSHAVEAGQAIDIMEFLWASLAVFDDEVAADTTEVYPGRPIALSQDAEAPRAHPAASGGNPEGAPLARFLPEPAEIADSESHRALRRRSAWFSTLIAGLELAKQGDVVLGQGEISRRSILPRRNSTRYACRGHMAHSPPAGVGLPA